MKRIAIQGYQGAFHQEAAENYFGKNIELVECETFNILIESIKNGQANFGVMAVENSLVGCILPNFMLLRESRLNVIGEVYLKITQNLMALPSQSINDLNQVQSHGMAIAQCKPFFKSYPNIQLVESVDTALSAKHIAQKQLAGIGAIGSSLAASLYGLEVLASSIESNKMNFTRFLVIGPVYNQITNNGIIKATIAFTAKHSPGGLASLLTSLANEGINLMMLHSLPMVGSVWEYIFHADLCYQSMEHARSLMIWLSKQVSQLWVMGVYPTNFHFNNHDITLN